MSRARIRKPAFSRAVEWYSISRQRLQIDCERTVSGRRLGYPILWHPRRVRQDRCGERVMDATLVLIDSDAELLRARALVEQLWNSSVPADVARLEAQARLIAAYEEKKW